MPPRTRRLCLKSPLSALRDDDVEAEPPFFGGYGKVAVVFFGDVFHALDAEAVEAGILLFGDGNAVFDLHFPFKIIVDMDGYQPARRPHRHVDDALLPVFDARDRLDGVFDGVAEQGV